MADIDETSAAIGEIRGTIAAIPAVLNQINDKLTLMNGSVAAAHKRIDTVEKTANDAKEAGEDYQLTKRRGIMALIGIGAAGGAGSTGVFKILGTLFGGGQ